MNRGGGEQRRGAGGLLAASSTFKEVFLFLFVFLPLFAPGAARGAPLPVPPRPEKYVTDNAGVLSAPAAGRLNEKLAAFERETSNQVLFWVDRRVPEGTTLEEFANRCFREWGVGQKGKSNGVVFVYFTEDHRMRMEVGYGLEGAIPDARAHRIDAEIIAPRFRAGDVAGGLDAGADAIFAAARGEPYKGTGTTAAEKGRSVGGPYRVIIPAALLLGFGALFVLAFRAARSRATAPRGAGRSRGVSSSSSDSSSWSSSSSSDSSSSDSSSSSDFSGGGGDSGGGGSSDSD